MKANRKLLLWPWPWGACLRSGLGPGVPAGHALKAHGRFGAIGRFGGLGRFWRVPGWFGRWRFGGPRGFWGGLEGLEGFEGFGAFGEFWSLRSVGGLANGSFENQYKAIAVALAQGLGPGVLV